LLVLRQSVVTPGAEVQTLAVGHLESLPKQALDLQQSSKLVDLA